MKGVLEFAWYVFVIVVYPFLAIWAANVLLGAEFPYDIEHWAAVCAGIMIVKGWRLRSEKHWCRRP